jgi:hypothetical protein
MRLRNKAANSTQIFGTATGMKLCQFAQRTNYKKEIRTRKNRDNVPKSTDSRNMYSDNSSSGTEGK